ncbi:MAG: DUF4476 domain-containing protein [Chitinophagales bacterium]
MKKLVLTTAIAFLQLAVWAQLQPTGNLTIFSEDGYKFYLILNGERQNDKPETNIRLEELTQPYYNAKIIFEDKTKGEISKNALMLTDADGQFTDVTYKIKSGKDGKQVLRYFSSTPIVPNMPPPSRPVGVPVYHFGVTTAVVPATTTTVTTTTTTPGTTVTVGVPGINVQITDPLLVEQHTTTTTTTTHTNVPPAQQVPAGCVYAMAPGNFQSALASISKSGFDETRLSTAKSVLNSNCVSCNQIIQICKIFSFEETKLAFAKFAYGRCVDPQNYFTVNDVFSFDSSKEDLNGFIAR